MFNFSRKTCTCLFLKMMSVRNDLECNIVGFCLSSVFILLEYCCSVSREHTEKLGGNNDHMEILSCYLSQVIY